VQLESNSSQKQRANCMFNEKIATHGESWTFLEKMQLVRKKLPIACFSRKSATHIKRGLSCTFIKKSATCFKNWLSIAHFSRKVQLVCKHFLRSSWKKMQLISEAYLSCIIFLEKERWKSHLLLPTKVINTYRTPVALSYMRFFQVHQWKKKRNGKNNENPYNFSFLIRKKLWSTTILCDLHVIHNTKGK
jgi:hypothetical protein